MWNGLHKFQQALALPHTVYYPSQPPRMNQAHSGAFSRDNSFFQEKAYPVYGQPAIISHSPPSSSNALPLPFPSEIPIQITCPFCNCPIETHIERRTGTLTWVTSLALLPCLLCALPWVLGPTFKEAVHWCPRCHQQISP